MQVHDRPLRCSNCFSQHEGLHVEFDAAWDGPVVNQIAVVSENAEAVAIDDLILCETCLKAAARLVGWVHAPDLVDARDKAVDALRIAEERLTKDRKVIGHLEATIEALSERVGGFEPKVVIEAKKLIASLEPELEEAVA